MREKTKELTLLLLYLTSWEEKGLSETFHRSWKGYPFEIMNELSEEGLISGSKSAKSVYFSKKELRKHKKLRRNIKASFLLLHI